MRELSLEGYHKGLRLWTRSVQLSVGGGPEGVSGSEGRRGRWIKGDVVERMPDA